MPKRVPRPIFEKGTGPSKSIRVKIAQRKVILSIILGAMIIAAAYLTFWNQGKAFAPTFSINDTWTWSGTTLENGAENSFTRTETVTGKQQRLGRECWAIKTGGGDNFGGYSTEYVYVGGEGWYVAGSESFIDNVKVSETTPSGPILSIEFPLEVGKRWVDVRGASGYDNLLGIESMEFQMISRGEVLSKETVTVPAGTFQAYKIEFTTIMSGVQETVIENQELSTQVSTTITGVRWYSDSVKNVVKETTDVTTIATVLWETTTTNTHAEIELNSYSLGG